MNEAINQSLSIVLLIITLHKSFKTNSYKQSGNNVPVHFRIEMQYYLLIIHRKFICIFPKALKQ